MAAIETTRTAPFGAITIHRIVRLAEGALLSLREWNDLRKTRNALSKLSERELADIGLTRADIDSLKPSRF